MICVCVCVLAKRRMKMRKTGVIPFKLKDNNGPKTDNRIVVKVGSEAKC